MVKELIKLAGKAAGTAKNILFADPQQLYKQQRHLFNEPFFFHGTNGRGVLLVHGWTATPYEVRRLAKFLNENGYSVMGIKLTGHGTFPKDIENVKWQTWMEDIRNGFDELSKTCEKVYVGGTSMGASLTLMLAKERQEVAGIILMAAPYKIKKEKLTFFAIKMLSFFGKRYQKKFYPPTFGLSSLVTRMISYQIYPIKSVLELLNLLREARRNLENVKQPCLLMQSTHDHIVAKNSMERFYAEIGSEIKKKQYIHKAYHTFISDIKNKHVFNDILEFLNGN